MRPVSAPTTRPNSPPPPGPPSDDDTVPGPSTANPDSFDVQRAAVSRVLAAGQSPGRKRGREALTGGGAAAATKRARMELETTADSELTRAMQRLKDLCQRKNIVIKDSLYRLLGCCPDNIKVLFIEKLLHYFAHAHPQIKDTVSISSFMGVAAAANNIKRFVGLDNDAIAWFAGSGHLKSISSMCSSRGLPERAAVERFLALPCLQQGGVIDTQILKSISSIFCGKGIPGADQTAELLSLPILQCDGEIDRQLLAAISAMCSGKRFPKPEHVTRLLSLPCLRVGGAESGAIDHKRLSSVASMSLRSGLPDPEKVEKLLALSGLHTGGDVDQHILSSISNMCRSKKIPNPEDVRVLLELDCLQEGSQLNKEALRSISSMQNGKGLPDQERVIGLLSRKELYIDGVLNSQALKCIGMLYHKKCIPGAAELARLFALPSLQTEGSHLYLDMLMHIAVLGHAKGFPSDTVIEQAISRCLELPEGAMEAFGDDEIGMDLDFVLDDLELQEPAAPGTSSSATVRLALGTRASAPRPARRERLEPGRVQLTGEQQAELDASKQRLVALCQSKNIVVKDRLHDAIGSCPDSQKKAFVDKAICFFEHVGDWVGNTQILTSMLGSAINHRNAFIGLSDDDIRYIARSDHLKVIATMCKYRGLPKAAEMEAVLGLDCLQVGGQFNVKLFKVLAGLCYGKGFPAASAVTDLLTMPAFQINGEFNYQLFKAVAPIRYGKGLPKVSEVEELLSLLRTQSGGTLDMSVLKSISALYRSRGFPPTAEVSRLLSLVKTPDPDQLDRQLLGYIASFGVKKGFPSAAVIAQAKAAIERGDPAPFEDDDPDMDDVEEAAEVQATTSADPPGQSVVAASTSGWQRPGSFDPLAAVGSIAVAAPETAADHQPAPASGIESELMTGLHFLSPLSLPAPPAPDGSSPPPAPDGSPTTRAESPSLLGTARSYLRDPGK